MAYNYQPAAFDEVGEMDPSSLPSIAYNPHSVPETDYPQTGPYHSRSPSAGIPRSAREVPKRREVPRKETYDHPTANVEQIGDHSATSSQNPITPSPEPEQQARRGVRRRTTDMFARTTIHWYVPTAMVVVWILGIIGALGHHAFYSSLHGKPAKNQLMMNRYGTAFAFFTKACLVGAAVLAYRQRVWNTIRNKPVSIRGLDALFSIVEDPSWFLMTTEIWKKAKVATVMAMATWIIPFASVVAPGSLTAQLREVTHPDALCNVASLNFTQEGDSDWTKPRHGRVGYNLAFFNTTPPPPAKSDYLWFDQPSKQTDRLLTLARFKEDGPLFEHSTPCEGFNCTYTMDFEAPWYNCMVRNWMDSPFNATDFVPSSPPKAKGGKNYVYQMTIEGPQYRFPQPNFASTKLQGQGVFEAEPKLWFGYVVNTTRPVADQGPNSRWLFSLENHAFVCTHQRANYRVTSQWSNGLLVNRTTKISNGVDLLPAGQKMSPENGFAYKTFVGMHTIGYYVSNWLKGTINQDGKDAGPVTLTDISNTRLIVQTTSWPPTNFMEEFQRFYEEVVMSLLSEPYLEIATIAEVECVKSRWENQYSYSRTGLWVGYALAVAAALVSMIFGAFSIKSNGMCSDTTFSKVLVTTRNRTLDSLVLSMPGLSLGGHPVSRSFDKTELQFGVIQNAYKDFDTRGSLNETRHTAFGVRGEVTAINRQDIQDGQDAQTTRGHELRHRNAFPGAGLGVLPG